MIRFRKEIQSFTYLNPFENFLPFEGRMEVRWDPLTSLTSRIIYFPGRKKIDKTDVRVFENMAPPDTCPFCPPNIEKMTSKFRTDLFGVERITEDGITLIPNLLTFDKYCIVAIITKEHFLDMSTIAERGYITSGIKALISVLRKIRERDTKVKYISINCNYMPMSGSSVLHPHIQAIAGEVPTNYHRLMVEKSERFFKKYGKVYWDALIEKESEIGDRIIGQVGSTFWYSPFSPKGNMDVGCIFTKSSILDLEENDLKDFEEGFRKVLNYFISENVPGYNLSLFSARLGTEESFRANIRIVARRFLPPTGATDANYFHILHMESTSVFYPEEVAHAIREIWGKRELE